MQTRTQQILQEMLDIQAISINIQRPFIWTSGIKAPIYCDNRKSLGHYALRRRITMGLCHVIQAQFSDVDIIGGTATAGIPHATSVADELALPLVYFRAKPKDNGTQAVIEGDYMPGQKVVIIEDLISTGGSVRTCVEHAEAAGLKVLGVLAIFNYELKAAVDNFAAANMKVVSLARFEDLYQTLNLSPDEATFIDNWRNDPQNDQLWDQKVS